MSRSIAASISRPFVVSLSLAVLIGTAFAALILSGCASGHHVYTPSARSAAAGAVRASDGGLPVAVYPVAGGEITVATLGVRETGYGYAHGRHIVVRIEAANTSAAAGTPWAPWAIDLPAQKAIFTDGERAPERIVRADGGEDPRLIVPPGERRAAELHYRIPGSSVPRFELAWRIDTGPNDSIRDRTTFTRAPAPPAASSTNVATSR